MVPVLSTINLYTNESIYVHIIKAAENDHFIVILKVLPISITTTFIYLYCLIRVSYWYTINKYTPEM